MTGKQKFDEAGKKLHEDKIMAEKAEADAMALAKKNLSEEMQKMMQSDARQEAKLSLPWLNVYVANRSTVTLADGSDPHDGWFYYSPKQEEFENPLCHILHISRGFRILQKDDKGNMVPRYMHFISGLIEDDTQKPFVLKISGKNRLERFWEFRDVIRKLNKAGYPTFALLVKLSTEKITFKAPDGVNRAAKLINFEISKTDGVPDLVTDKDLYLHLRDLASETKQQEEEFLQNNEVGKDGKPIQKVDDNDVIDSDEVPPQISSPDEIPLGEPDF